VDFTRPTVFAKATRCCRAADLTCAACSLDEGRRIFLFKGVINLKRIRKWIVPLLCGLTVVLLFRFVFFIGYVPSASMEPTIKHGSYIFGWRIHGELKRGDIIVFRREGRTLVKRVAAAPGDAVYLCDADHSVSINEETETATRILTVPDGCYFVLGDNAENSLDSRYWEWVWVNKEDVVGKALD
jgi:signal peptidase I